MIKNYLKKLFQNINLNRLVDFDYLFIYNFFNLNTKTYLIYFYMFVYHFF